MRRGIRTLQRVRALKERQAQARLAAAEREVAVRSQNLAHERATHRARRQPASVQGGVGLQQSHLQAVASLERVDAAAAALAGAETHRDERDRERIAASVSRRSLDRLVERREERAAVEREAALQRAADEAAVLRHEVGPWS